MISRNSYRVNDLFYTLQGEGAHAGTPAVFVRFSGCNGWSGRAQDRAKGPLPCSRWCDTDFATGQMMDEDELVRRILAMFPTRGYRMVIFTGGEPALQLTNGLIRKLHPDVPALHVETNGTLPLPEAVMDHCWITVSPKTAKVVQTKCMELKLVYPTIEPETFDYISAFYRFLQPLDNADRMRNTDAAVRYCKAHPHWRLSLQTHKYGGFT